MPRSRRRFGTCRSAARSGSTSNGTPPRRSSCTGAPSARATRCASWRRPEELQRSTTLAWYRNPPRSAGDSLCIAYRDELGDWHGLYPDFLIFERVGDEVMPSIVDPHRWDLPDAKLRALARYAETYGDLFHRIESVVVEGGHVRRLDLLSQRNRSAVRYSNGAEPLDLYPRVPVPGDVDDA